MSDPTSLQTEAVRLALAACVGKGAETRDVVELAAAVVGEVFQLRGKMADAEANARQAAEVAERRAEMIEAAAEALEKVTAQRDAVINDVLPDVPVEDGHAICEAIDRLEKRIKGGGRMRIDVVMTDAVNMAADVFDGDGALLDPLEQLSALLLLRSASSEGVRQVVAAGHEAWTAKQSASARIRLGEAARELDGMVHDAYPEGQ